MLKWLLNYYRTLRENSCSRHGGQESPFEVSNVLIGDAIRMLKTLPNCSVQCCVTSPPYFGLRDYGHAGQIGLEATPEAYIEKLVEIFREVRRLLRDDGTLWLNLGDSYNRSGKGQSAIGENDPKKRKTRGMKVPVAGIGKLKHKDLIGIPWRVALALQADGWYLRQDIIWHKPNPMPESVTDRCTKAHEYIFLLSKSPNYFFDAEAVKEPAIYGLNSKEHRPSGIVRDRLYGYDSKEAALRGRSISQTRNGITIRHPNGKHAGGQQSPKTLVDYRNKRSVWTVTTKPYQGAHFATFPRDLIEPCILAGCPEGGVVLDPFLGSGTTALVAKDLKRRFIGVELNPAYLPLIDQRLGNFFVPVVA